MRKLIRKTVNSLIAPTGLEIRRKLGPTVSREALRSAIQELHDGYIDKVFPALPQVAGRIDRLVEAVGLTATNALYLLDCLHKSLQQPGDVCEFGVCTGTTSALIANELRDTERNLWLFDSFQGLSKPTGKDHLLNDVMGLGSMEAYEGAMACPADVVIRRLAEIQFPANRTRIVRGFIEDSLARGEAPSAVCFAFVDFDLYEPILTALKFLSRTLSTEGYVLVHDYGFLSSGAQTAVDEFVASQGGNFQLILPPPYAGHFAILRKVG